MSFALPLQHSKEQTTSLFWSLILHVTVLGGGFLIWEEAKPPVVGSEIIAVDFVMESPMPGGAEGVQQQLVEQQETVQSVVEEISPVEEKTEQLSEPEHQVETVNLDAKIEQDVPVSKFSDIVLKAKPKPPAKNQTLKKIVKARPVQKTFEKKELSQALINIKGQTQGETLRGSFHHAGVQKQGMAGEVISARYRLGSASNPKPKYPKMARKRGWEGRVILKVQINAEGRPLQIDVVHSSGRKVLDRAALKAVKKWKFTPARKAGIRVASQLTVPIRFDLLNS